MSTYRPSRFFSEGSDDDEEAEGEADVGAFAAMSAVAPAPASTNDDDDDEEEEVEMQRRLRVPRPKRPTLPRPTDFDGGGSDDASSTSARSTPKRKRSTKKQPRVIEAIGPIAEVDLYAPEGDGAVTKREYIPYSELRRKSVTRNCPCCYWNFGMAVEYKIQPQLYKMRKLYEACKATYPVDVTAQRVSEFFNDEILPEERSKGTAVTSWSAAVVQTHITQCLDDPMIQLKCAIETCKAWESELGNMVFYVSGGKKAYDAKAMRDALMLQSHRFKLEKMDVTKMQTNLDSDRSGLGMFIVEPPNAKR